MKHLFSLCIFLFVLSCSSLSAQRSAQVLVPQACSGTDLYLNYFIAQLDRCDDLFDISIELYGELMERIQNLDCEVTTIDVITQTDGYQTITIGWNTETTVSFFNLSSLQETIYITLNGKDDRGNTVFSVPIEYSTRKAKGLAVSESFLAEIFDMGHLPANPLAPPTVGPHGDIFTYWCGRRMNVVTLLAFYQDFLGLSEYHVCRIIEILENYNITYWNLQSVTWTGVYCDLLWEFWDDYVTHWNGNNNGGGGEEEEDESACECQVINTGVFVNHSIGETASEQLEECPEVSLTEEYRVMSHSGPSPNTHNERNWLISKWAYMGAAKSLYTISQHWRSGDRGRFKINTELPQSMLKSSITMALKCMIPRNAAISSDCECEKTVTASALYNSHITGIAEAEGGLGGNGKVKSCMEDFATFTRWTRNDFSILDAGFATACVECESTDTTNVFTDLGSIATELEEAVPVLLDPSLANADQILNTLGGLVELYGTLISESCGDIVDTTYVLFDQIDNFTLSPSNDYVQYVVSSRALSRTDFEDDDSWSEMHLISNYGLAVGLESAGDSTCCNELVGVYSIGDLGEFTEAHLATVNGDNAVFEGFDFKLDGQLENGSWLEYGGLYQQMPLTLEHLQVDVAELFAVITPYFLEDVFGIPCGPGCTSGVDCYYNCGFWGECHEDGFIGTGLVAAFSPPDSELGLDLPSLNFIPTEDVSIYPNPINDAYELNISLKEGLGYESMFIFNAQGQLLVERPLSADKEQFVISAAELQRGMNMLVLKRSDGSLYVDQIIKQ